MLRKITLLFGLVAALNVHAITINEFSSKLVESHPYFVQLSLSEKTSLIDQKSSLTYSDWNIKASAGNSYKGGEDTAEGPIKSFTQLVMRSLLVGRLKILDLL